MHVIVVIDNSSSSSSTTTTSSSSRWRHSTTNTATTAANAGTNTRQWQRESDHSWLVHSGSSRCHCLQARIGFHSQTLLYDHRRIDLLGDLALQFWPDIQIVSQYERCDHRLNDRRIANVRREIDACRVVEPH